MHLDPTLLHAAITFVTGGGLLAVVSQTVKVVRALRTGVPVRERSVRIDIVKQRDYAIGYAHRLREALLTHGVPLTDIEPWPSSLKEHA